MSDLNDLIEQRQQSPEFTGRVYFQDTSNGHVRMFMKVGEFKYVVLTTNTNMGNVKYRVKTFTRSSYLEYMQQLREPGYMYYMDPKAAVDLLTETLTTEYADTLKMVDADDELDAIEEIHHLMVFFQA